GQGVGELRTLRWQQFRRRAKVREVVLVQNHPVVFETEPTGQLGEFGMTCVPSAMRPKLGELVVELVHLSYVASIEREMLRDLPVRDSLQPLEVTERMLRVHPYLRVRHVAIPFLARTPVIRSPDARAALRQP